MTPNSCSFQEEQAEHFVGASLFHSQINLEGKLRQRHLRTRSQPCWTSGLALPRWNSQGAMLQDLWRSSPQTCFFTTFRRRLARLLTHSPPPTALQHGSQDSFSSNHGDVVSVRRWSKGENGSSCNFSSLVQTSDSCSRKLSPLNELGVAHRVPNSASNRPLRSCHEIIGHLVK